MANEPFVIERTFNAPIEKVWKVITDKEEMKQWYFQLFPEGEKTRLKLTHTGLETFPAINPDFAKENFAQGWEHIIGKSLKEFLEK